MSPNTGHLVTSLAKMAPGDSYELLPSELNGAARLALKGGDEARVSLMAKTSRKRNR